jgi:hypothetical protein
MQTRLSRFSDCLPGVSLLWAFNLSVTNDAHLTLQVGGLSFQTVLHVCQFWPLLYSALLVFPWDPPPPSCFPKSFHETLKSCNLNPSVLQIVIINITISCYPLWASTKRRHLVLSLTILFTSLQFCRLYLELIPLSKT